MRGSVAKYCNLTMKKINIRGVFDGFRQSVSKTPKPQLGVEETLRSDHFQVAKVIYDRDCVTVSVSVADSLLAVKCEMVSTRRFEVNE